MVVEVSSLDPFASDNSDLEESMSKLNVIEPEPESEEEEVEQPKLKRKRISPPSRLPIAIKQTKEIKFDDPEAIEKEPPVKPNLPKKIKKKGTRQEVIDGLATMTSGGLTLEDLFVCEKTGNIKSKKASKTSKDLSDERKASKSQSPVKKAVKIYEENVQSNEESKPKRTGGVKPKEKPKPKAKVKTKSKVVKDV